MLYLLELVFETTPVFMRHSSFVLDVRSHYSIPNVTHRLWLVTKGEISMDLVAASKNFQKHAAVSKQQQPI